MKKSNGAETNTTRVVSCLQKTQIPLNISGISSESGVKKGSVWNSIKSAKEAGIDIVTSKEKNQNFYNINNVVVLKRKYTKRSTHHVLQSDLTPRDTISYLMAGRFEFSNSDEALPVLIEVWSKTTSVFTASRIGKQTIIEFDLRPV